MKIEDKVEFARKIFYPKISASLDSCNEKGVRLGTYEMSAVIKDQLDELVRRLDLSVDVSNYEPSETYRKAEKLLR